MLDFYKTTDRNRSNILHSLSEEFLEEIEKDLVASQISIDVYGTTRLYQSHISTLIDILQRRKLNKSAFFEFLVEMKKQEEGLIIEGD